MNWSEMSIGDKIMVSFGITIWLIPAVLMCFAALSGMYP